MMLFLGSAHFTKVGYYIPISKYYKQLFDLVYGNYSENGLRNVVRNSLDIVPRLTDLSEEWFYKNTIISKTHFEDEIDASNIE